jgi:hypothetical protein
MLMGMLFFIYAIVGMQLFGSLVMDPSTAIGMITHHILLLYFSM